MRIAMTEMCEKSRLFLVSESLDDDVASPTLHGGEKRDCELSSVLERLPAVERRSRLGTRERISFTFHVLQIQTR